MFKKATAKKPLTHVFKLSSLPEERYGDGGTLKLVAKDDFPILHGLSLFWVNLDNDGLALPHWHPNADELAYCISGKGKMSVVSPMNEKQEMEFGAGDLVFFPRGYFHYIESIGQEKLQFLAIFNHEQPEYLGIVMALAGMPADALGNSFKVPPATFKEFKKEDTILTKKSKK
jgi:oxalate decarboxylase